VTYVDPFHVSREIFRSTRNVPVALAAVYDSATAERIYTQLSSAGDDELLVNQGCSYGKHTDALPKSVVLSWGWTGQLAGTSTSPQGYAQLEFAVLYLTIP
jgi:hypothetical protein